MGHVLRLTEHLLYNIDPALQATFVSCIIIGWLLLTNVPHVHKIRQSASSKINFGTGMAISVVPKPTRPD